MVEYIIKDYIDLKLNLNDKEFLEILNSISFTNFNKFNNRNINKFFNVVSSTKDDIKFTNDYKTLINFNKIFKISCKKYDIILNNLRDNRRIDIDNYILCLNIYSDDKDMYGNEVLENSYIIQLNELNILNLYKMVDIYIKKYDISVDYNKNSQITKHIKFIDIFLKMMYFKYTVMELIVFFTGILIGYYFK